MILTEIKYQIKSEFKYKIALMMNLMVFPLLYLAQFFFEGSFVRKVTYFEVYISYFIFLVVSSIIYDSFSNFLRGGRFGTFINKREWIDYIVFGGIRYILLVTLVKTIFNLFFNSFYIFLVLLIFPRSFLFLLSIPLAILSSFPFYLLFLSLILAWRREEGEMIINWFVLRYLRLLIPISYSIFVIFKKYEMIFYILPFSSLYEILRKFIFLGTFELDSFLVSLISCSIWWIISVITFRKALEIARKTGKIKLK